MGKRILIITDAWNQMNGVVTTFENTIRELKNMGHEVKLITPDDFKTVPLPTYKEIKVAINPWKVSKLIEEAAADYIHVATEGPIGLFATNYLRKRSWAFTTSYHTKMPEYVNERFPFVSKKLVYRYMKHIHKKSKSVLVTTESMKRELLHAGFENDMIVWGRGVDTSIFNPEGRNDDPHTPCWLYVGRISPEKNLEALLDMKIIGVKRIVGDGPLLNHYKEKYKDNPYIIFEGAKRGKELQQAYVNADVFVFPSKTDTFGIVMLEAMACGTPVAAFPVTGPKDCVDEGVTGCLNDDLYWAVATCLDLDREKIAAVGLTKTWENCTQIFANSLVNKWD